MGISRTAIADDDGTGNTGTVLDNGWKQEFYDQIDAALGGGVVQTTTLTGSQDNFSLTTSAALLRANNATALTLTGLTAGTDGQRLDIVSVGAGSVTIADQSGSSTAVNRIISGCGEAITLAAGTGVARLIYDNTTQRWRCLGVVNAAWTQVAYAGGNYTSVGGGTWTVDSGDQTTYEYIKSQRAVTVNIQLDTTSISGTVSQLKVTVPVAGVKAAAVVALLYDNSSTVGVACRAFIIAGGTYIGVDKLDGSNFTASTNNTHIRLSITYEW